MASFMEKVPLFCLDAIRKKIDYLLEDLLELIAGTVDHVDLIFHDLRLLRDSCGFVGLEDISELCNLLGGYISKIHLEGKLKKGQGDQVLLETSYYLLEYQRCINNRAAPPAISDSLYHRLRMNMEHWDEGDIAEGNIVYRSQGVRAITTSKIIRIKLPNITSGSHCLSVIESLKRIFDGMPQDMNWLVDLSVFRNLPTLVYDVLVEYQKKLQGRGCQIELTGVHDELLPPDQMQELRSRFSIFGKNSPEDANLLSTDKEETVIIESDFED
jgi:hypothetical protein